ncbi:TetR/AcrR family transcriptional regulator [Micromonospora polyrhachis]|uniref:AcrR family transcriptional regulator n=1 Tax=Micromonospora polyrhachis TaxID=1282883 RepID=A0A7W7SRL2_9ACTN|nr:TetR/AcrR family transcriptional regulator [Micromonospora polyrhachis]MBB4959692.1 AcrR family transcriptional regulator [Micromonospora polyrhachis]
MSDTPRKRGPQARAARNDQALIEAAREVFIAQGFDAPVSAVAERAGVGMGSLYRRYRTKEELLQRLCADSLQHLAETARAALAIDDPWQGLIHHIVECVRFGFGALAPLAGTIDITPQMQEAAEQAQRFTNALITRAHRAKALRADVTTMDISLLIGQFSRPGPAPSKQAEEAARFRLLAIAVDGLRAHNATPLPSPPPDPRHYEAMWATH